MPQDNLKSGNFIYRDCCELCSSSNIRILYSREFIDPIVWNFIDAYYKGRINAGCFENARYEIAKCSECGFIWQTSILNNDLMEKLYNIWISPEDSLKKKKCAGISLFTGYAREVETIAYLLKKEPYNINVLDVGMGWGYWCLMAKAFGYNSTGIEVSNDRIEFARKNDIYVISWSDLSEEHFDFINAEQFFEHISEPLKILSLLTRSLRNKGIIHISVPNGKKIQRELNNLRWKPSKNAIHPLEHINCFTHKTLIKLAESSGLDYIKQPFLVCHRYNTKSYIKGVLERYYAQFMGTSLFFRKRMA